MPFNIFGSQMEREGEASQVDKILQLAGNLFTNVHTFGQATENFNIILTYQSCECLEFCWLRENSQSISFFSPQTIFMKVHSA